MKKIIFSIFILQSFNLLFAQKTQKDLNINQAIVKIYAVYNKPDYYDPWQMKGQRQATGSGVIIDGNRILTNAHIVSDNTFIQVKLAGRAKKFPAEVEIVAHDCDLAILKVEDKTFFNDTTKLQLGDLPKTRDRVAVYGFPEGGDELCITEGVISRIEHRTYTHNQTYLLTCQMDAAINPGSSGGPVVKNDKLVGIAFQAGGGENISYMVPPPLIKRFLKDIEDKKYDGIPTLCFSYQEMENLDLREKYKLQKEQSGILVTKIFSTTSVQGLLLPEDVILSIDDVDIENDGTIEFRKGERTSFGYIIQNKLIGDKISLKVLRNGNLESFNITLNTSINEWQLVPNEFFDTLPTYYIIGGFVFEPLNLNLLKEWGNWYKDAPKNWVYYYLYGRPSEERKEVVVLVKVLADELNMGYHDWRLNIVSSVNGKKISDIKDLVRTIETTTDKYLIIEDENGSKIVLNKEKVKQAQERILKKYKIEFDRSENLREENNKK